MGVSIDTPFIVYSVDITKGMSPRAESRGLIITSGEISPCASLSRDDKPALCLVEMTKVEISLPDCLALRP